MEKEEGKALRSHLFPIVVVVAASSRNNFALFLLMNYEATRQVKRALGANFDSIDSPHDSASSILINSEADKLLRELQN